MTEPLTVGDRTLLSVSDGHFIMPPDFLGAEEAHRHLADADGVARLPIGAFLLPGDEPVLLDAGIGPDFPPHPAFVGGGLLDGLRGLGVAPEEVRHVALSHLHHDHVGWVATERGGITFPNAQVYVAERDWQHFLGGDHEGPMPWIQGALRDLADSGRLTILDGERQLAPGLTALPAPGHTPGHTVFVIHDRGERALVLGDAVYCPAQLSEIDWAAATEVDPVLARQTREWLAREFDDGLTAAIGPHFPGLRASRLIGRQWT
jgi:glyoxylase-like metal-dependent hydrolase (beta-lactamase superfamily II)